MSGLANSPAAPNSTVSFGLVTQHLVEIFEDTIVDQIQRASVLAYFMDLPSDAGLDAHARTWDVGR